MFANLRQKWYRPCFVPVRLRVAIYEMRNDKGEMTERFKEFHQFA
jgi:hypothetical protein